MASKSRRFIGTRVAVPPTFWISSSVSSRPPTVRATQMTCAPAAPSAMAAARPMPRDAPVTSAIRFSRALVIGRACARSGDEQRELTSAAAAVEVSQFDRVVAGEAGVAELRQGVVALVLADG